VGELKLFMASVEIEMAVVAASEEEAKKVALRGLRDEDIGAEDFRITEPIGREVPNGWEADWIPHGSKDDKTLEQLYDEAGK
jgi:hypothetical protein